MLSGFELYCRWVPLFHALFYMFLYTRWCTMFVSITITLILLTNKIVASVILSRFANRKRSIVHRQRASNIDCSTVFDFTAFHNLVSANNYDLMAWFKVMP